MFIEGKIREIQDRGYCVLRARFAPTLIDASREAFGPILTAHLKDHGCEPNRGLQRHFLPMPFDPPCFVPEFLFDTEVLSLVRSAMDDRVVADQWGCDVALTGSGYQGVHVDYQRPLFAEYPDMLLPNYMLVVSFGLSRVTMKNGPIEIAPGTHRMARDAALDAVSNGEIGMEAVELEVGDVLIRHPWALHRGTPNMTESPRILVSIRYVRRWYVDHSREVNAVPRRVWEGLTAEQQSVMRYPVEFR
jgi:ectoine hydroxylase-related dioxygenase (phytanoyl-CoA dioxygenase family)